jgi:hypothetical protein
MKRNMIISASSLNTFGSCERMFNFGTIMSLSPKNQNEKSDKMIKGSLMHKLLELHYTLKFINVELGEIIIKVMDFGRFYGQSKFPTLSEENIENVVRTYKEYALHYKFENYIVDNYSGKPAVEIPFAKVLFEDDEIRLIVEGIIDFLGSNNSASVVMDHKTGTSEPYLLDNQFQLYACVADKEYVIVNRILFGEKVNSPYKFQRVAYKYSDEMKKSFINAIITKAKRIDTSFRKGYFEPNFSACRNYNHPCAFYEICTQEEKYWPAVISTSFEEKEPFNPMKDKESIEDVVKAMSV